MAESPRAEETRQPHDENTEDPDGGTANHPSPSASSNHSSTSRHNSSRSTSSASFSQHQQQQQRSHSGRSSSAHSSVSDDGTTSTTTGDTLTDSDDDEGKKGSSPRQGKGKENEDKTKIPAPPSRSGQQGGGRVQSAPSSARRPMSSSSAVAPGRRGMLTRHQIAGDYIVGAAATSTYNTGDGTSVEQDGGDMSVSRRSATSAVSNCSPSLLLLKRQFALYDPPRNHAPPRLLPRELSPRNGYREGLQKDAKRVANEREAKYIALITAVEAEKRQEKKWPADRAPSPRIYPGPKKKGQQQQRGSSPSPSPGSRKHDKEGQSDKQDEKEKEKTGASSSTKEKEDAKEDTSKKENKKENKKKKKKKKKNGGNEKNLENVIKHFYEDAVKHQDASREKLMAQYVPKRPASAPKKKETGEGGAESGKVVKAKYMNVFRKQAAQKNEEKDAAAASEAQKQKKKKQAGGEEEEKRDTAACVDWLAVQEVKLREHHRQALIEKYLERGNTNLYSARSAKTKQEKAVSPARIAKSQYEIPHLRQQERFRKLFEETTLKQRKENIHYGKKIDEDHWKELSQRLYSSPRPRGEKH